MQYYYSLQRYKFKSVDSIPYNNYLIFKYFKELLRFFSGH